jgi:hypothetical protein
MKDETKYPDYELIESLSTKFLSHSIDALTKAETVDLINHLREAVRELSSVDIPNRLKKQVSVNNNTMRPPVEHVAWVFKHLTDHLHEGGSYRYLIYDRMGFGYAAYSPLFEAGGMELSNTLNDT